MSEIRPPSRELIGDWHQHVDRPTLTTVLLSWNRCDLLRTTISSYFETVSVSFELIMIDNGSDDDSPAIIQAACNGRSNVRTILLPENRGGDALNLGFADARGSFFHVSENDIEYLQGWDTELLSKFEAFPQVGQLSLFGVTADSSHYRFVELTEHEGASVLVTSANVGSTSVFRREIWDAGGRWTSRPDGFRAPDDVRFSDDVRGFGYAVAWNDRTVIVNHGHEVEEWIRRLPYYVASYSGKSYRGIEGLRRRLLAGGYALTQNIDGSWKAVKVAPAPS
jgi:glycosyltransferase involved in cell wall biosynthesis